MIKHYIFDFGDVFINLDKQGPKKAMKDYGIIEVSDDMLTNIYMYEKGLVTTKQFLGFYQNQFPKATKNILRNAWKSMILDFPMYRLEFLEEFCKTNSCFLLSNINELHIEYIKEKLGNTFYKRFYSCFKKVYYSNEIQLRKPDASIFEYVFEESKLIPKDCFFVDDTPENTDMATKLGVQCWNLNPAEDDIIELPTILSQS